MAVKVDGRILPGCKSTLVHFFSMIWTWTWPQVHMDNGYDYYLTITTHLWPLTSADTDTLWPLICLPGANLHQVQDLGFGVRCVCCISRVFTGSVVQVGAC